MADGSLLAYGSYKEFIDYIASIYNSSLNYFCSEADWQTSVTTYGSCGKFVYDSVNTEDVDTDGEDHIYDELRYMCMERPIFPLKRERQGIVLSSTLADPLDLSPDTFLPYNRRAEYRG